MILRTATPPLLVLLATASCNWLSLAKNALGYRELVRGEAGNLAATDSLVFATLAEDGLAIVDGRSGRVLASLLPPHGSESVDDLAVADNLLFVLDARAPGHLSAYSLRDPLHPRLVSAPREVPVGPFSGVAARAGLCIVSGGTSALTAWRYDSNGLLADPPASADLGRGQPDVMLANDGRVAYISTHYWGPYFGLDVVGYDAASPRLSKLAKLEIDGAGFTTGGAKPANFPIEAAALGLDTVLVAHGRGVAVIDVHEPGRPRLLEAIDVGGPAVNVDALGAVALVAVSGPSPALVLLTFAGGRATVTRRIALASGTFPAGVALTATHAAVALGDRGVQVFQR